MVTLAAGLDGSKVSSGKLTLTGKVTDNVGVTQLFVGFNKVDVLPDGSFMARQARRRREHHHRRRL